MPVRRYDAARRRRSSALPRWQPLPGVDLNRWVPADARGVVHCLLTLSITAQAASSAAAGFPLSAGWFCRSRGYQVIQHQLVFSGERARLRAARRLFLSSTSISTSSIRRWCPGPAWYPPRQITAVQVSLRAGGEKHGFSQNCSPSMWGRREGARNAECGLCFVAFYIKGCLHRSCRLYT